MADEPKRTQKQVAQKYKDNLDYYRRPHPFRRSKLILFCCAVIISLALAFGFNSIVGDKSAETFFNTGPLSKNHANLAEGCQSCHWGATPDFAHLVQIGSVIGNAQRQANPALEKIRVALLKSKEQGTSAEARAKGLLRAYTDLSALEKMDVACVACHVQIQRLPVSLHCPQAANIQLAKFTPNVLVVESGTCSTCHREHLGPEAMPMPASERACAVCHNDEKTMTSLVQGGHGAHRVTVPGAVPVLAAQNYRTGEGIVRFLVPRIPARTPSRSRPTRKTIRPSPTSPRNSRATPRTSASTTSAMSRPTSSANPATNTTRTPASRSVHQLPHPRCRRPIHPARQIRNALRKLPSSRRGHGRHQPAHRRAHPAS